ncbi:MAG: hypothetical protein ABEJ65_03440, partial [bacterium]
MRYTGGQNTNPVSEKRDHDESMDPYLNITPPREPARCSVCRNIFRQKRWYRSDQIELPDGSDPISFTCPGCRKVQDGAYSGELKVRGEFLNEHHTE